MNDNKPEVDMDRLIEAIQITTDYEAALVRRWRETRRFKQSLVALREGVDDLNGAIWKGAA